MIFLEKRLFFFSFLLLVCSLLSCQRKEKIPPPLPIEVKVQTIEPKTIPATFDYVGVVQSSHEVEIRARVIGYLDEISYLEGSFVDKGELLFQLDPLPFQVVLSQERAQLAREQAVLWQAKRAVARYKPLYEQKAASQRDLDNALAQEMSAEAQVLAAEAQVASAEINLSYTTIRSPVSGLAGQAKYRVGSLISPSQDLMTTISVTDPIWVNFSVSEQDLLNANKEKQQDRLIFPYKDHFEVELTLADQTVYPYKGEVSFASPTFSQKTGTMMVRAIVPNPKELIRPGQFVRVKVLGALRPHALVVPQQAVVQSKKGTFVFVVNHEQRAEMRPIEPGPWDQNNWVIYEGLQAGDQVIVEGVNKVVPGAVVKIIQDTSLPKEAPFS